MCAAWLSKGFTGPATSSVEELLGLKLILGTFDPLSVLLRPAWQRLYYLAQVTDWETVAPEELNDVSKFFQPGRARLSQGENSSL